MLSIETKGKILVLKLIGELTAEHFDEVADLVDEKIAANEEAPILVDLRRYEGAHDLGTAWQEFKLVQHYGERVDKIAVIGSLDWQKLATRLVSPFTRARERFFEPGEMDEAIHWLRS